MNEHNRSNDGHIGVVGLILIVLMGFLAVVIVCDAHWNRDKIIEAIHGAQK